MMKKKLTALALAVLLAISAAGCQQAQEQESSPAPESSVSVSEPESTPPQDPESSGEDSSAPESSGNEVVNTITTDNEEFNKLFSDNPIDAAYREESMDDFSAVDMEQTAAKFADLWQAEVDSAYQKLLDLSSGSERDQYKTEQEAWIAETPAALEEIRENAQAAGGSLSNVTAAGDAMEYYRARAAELYRELYNYDPDFSFVYSENGSASAG